MTRTAGTGSGYLLLAFVLCAPTVAPAQAIPTTVERPAPPPAPTRKPSGPPVLDGVTCFACPEGANSFQGSNCISGIACAAAAVTPDGANAAIRAAMRHLEAARAALANKKTPRSKALKELEAALKELQMAGVKTTKKK